VSEYAGEKIQTDIDGKALAAPDWTGIRTERVDYRAGAKVFRQGAILPPASSTWKEVRSGSR
jgi:hypothetical protein